jgi:hypothetical protein
MIQEQWQFPDFVVLILGKFRGKELKFSGHFENVLLCEGLGVKQKQ